MAVPVKVNNGAALLRAGKDILPYAILFYMIDFFIWYASPSSLVADANLASNILISSVFIAGFFVIDFHRSRKAQKMAMESAAAAPRVVVVQQPVYLQGPPPGYPYPGYQQPYAPPPQQGYPPYGYTGYPGQQPTPPPALPPAPPARAPPQPPAQPPPPPRDEWEPLPDAPPAQPTRKRPPGGAP